MKQNIKKSYIRNLIKKVINESAGVEEGRMVDKFTPYTPEEREQNFIPFTNKDNRTLFQKNPSYEKALRDAEERRRQRELQRKNESIDEVMNYGAERVASDNNYVNNFYDRHVRSKIELCDKYMEIGNIAQISRCYKTLLNAYSMEEIQQDSRLIKIKEQIKNKLEEIISFIRNKMANRRNESRQHVTENEIRRVITDVLKEWKNKINEDGYSYNGLDQQAQYRKMGEDLMAQQNREKNKKKNIMLFKRAYNKIYKEYSIIGQLRRKTEKAKEIFNGPAFMKFVEEVEGDTLYNPIWEKYGGEYEELADQYLQVNVIKLRRELGI